MKRVKTHIKIGFSGKEKQNKIFFLHILMKMFRLQHCRFKGVSALKLLSAEEITDTVGAWARVYKCAVKVKGGNVQNEITHIYLYIQVHYFFIYIQDQFQIQDLFTYVRFSLFLKKYLGSAFYFYTACFLFRPSNVIRPSYSVLIFFFDNY